MPSPFKPKVAVDTRTARLRAIVLICLCFVGGLAAGGCELANVDSDSNAGGEGPGHRQQSLALSPEQELQLGRQAYKAVLSNPNEYGRVLPPEQPECRRVHGIAERIIRAAGIEPLQREMNLRKGYRFEWETNVLAKDQINAFCLPGGKIAVFQGLLRVTQNDDQLATVLSHEIAHALAHHSSERLAHEQMNRGGLGIIWNKSFDRQEEAEADHIGLFLMTFAGYNPDEAVHFWERMERSTADRARLPEILSDHPSDAHRIQKMQDWVPYAKAAKLAYEKQGNAPPPR